MRELPPTAGLPFTGSDFINALRGKKLENELASFLSVPQVQIHSSGTACLVIALECLKRRSGRREVVIPAYTCPLVALAVKQAGLEIKLCDSKPDSLDLDPKALAALTGDDTLCIIPTHMAGLPADLEPVLGLARQSGAYVIEDAAQALGATWHGRPVGTIADIGLFSLACGKGLTTGEGGFLVANDPELRRDLMKTGRDLSRFEPLDELRTTLLLFSYALLYNPRALRLVYGEPLRAGLRKGDLVGAVGDRFGDVVTLSEIGSWRKALAAAALERLPASLEQHARLGRQRAGELNGMPGVLALTEAPGASGNWPFIFVLLDSEKRRDAVMERLWTAGLGVTRLFIHDLAGYEYLKKIVPPVSAPNAASIAARSLTITNSHWLRDVEFAALCHALEQTRSELEASRDLEGEKVAL